MELSNTDNDDGQNSKFNFKHQKNEKKVNLSSADFKEDTSTSNPPLKRAQTLAQARSQPRRFNSTKTVNQDVAVQLKNQCADEAIKQKEGSQLEPNQPEQNFGEIVSQLQVIEEEDLTNDQKLGQINYLYSEIKSIQKFSQFLASRVNQVDRKFKDLESCSEIIKKSSDMFTKLLSTQMDQSRQIRRFEEQMKETQDEIVKLFNDRIQQGTDTAQDSVQVLQLRIKAFNTNLESLTSRFQFYESENARVFRIIHKQAESIQGLLTLQDFEIKFDLFKSLTSKQVLNVVKENFMSKEEHQNFSNQNQQHLKEFQTKLDERLESVTRLADDIERQRIVLQQKVFKKDFHAFQEKVYGMPSVKKVNQLSDEMVKIIEDAKLEMQNFRQEFEDQKYIIRKYDELICQKASKHSLQIIKDDLFKQNTDQKKELIIQKKKTAEVFSHYEYISKQLGDALIEQKEQAKVILQLKSQQKVVDMIEMKLEQLNRNVKLKVMVDDFDKQVSLKANQTDFINQQNHIKNLESVLQTFGVVLQESQMLHTQRADETYQSKQNKVSRVIANIQSMMNNISSDFSQLSKVAISEEMVCQIHNAFPLSSRSKNLRSGRVKTSRNYRSYLPENNATSVKAQSPNEMILEMQSSKKKSLTMNNNPLKHSSTTELFQKVSLTDCPSSESLKKAPFIISSQVTNKNAAFKMLSSKHKASGE